MVPTTFTKRDHRRQYDKEEVLGRGLKNNRAPHKAKRESMLTISHGNGRFTIVIFNCSFLILLFGEMALQVIKSDSRMPISLYLHRTKSFSRYMHLRRRFALTPTSQQRYYHYFSLLLLYQFLGVIIFHDSARSAQLTVRH